MIYQSNVNLDLNVVLQGIFIFITSCDSFMEHDIQGWHCQLHFTKVDTEVGTGTKAL